MSVEIGQKISHYKILEKLGEGGMGVVYKAEDTSLNRHVALKFLPPHLTMDEATRKRFLVEAQAASSLDHPNICNIHEINKTPEEDLYICMAYYNGRSLRQKIENGPIPLDEAIDIIEQISRGLDAAHEESIIHRDIKPGNIIITEKGGAKIVDFGLAKLVGEKLTETISTKGTIAYMAPEIIRGLPGDHRADIWSLGVLLFEMLSGHLPFRGEYAEPLMYAIVHEQPDPLTNYLKKVPDSLLAIIDRLLKKNPADRYQYLNELILDLSRVKTDPNSKITSLKSGIGVIDPIKRAMVKEMPAIILIILIIIVVGYFYISRIVTTDLPEASINAGTYWKNSIAVLPLENNSTDSEMDNMCDIIAAQIRTNLSKLKGLKVIGSRSVKQYENSSKTTTQIGEELKVASILDGSFSKFDDRIRIIFQLIETNEGTQLWGEYYDYVFEFDSIFTLIDKVSNRTAYALINNLSTEEVEQLKTDKPRNSEAYEYFMKGYRFFHKRFSSTRDIYDFNLSEKMFKMAIELDPNYISSYLELAELYTTYGWYVAITVSFKEREYYWAKGDSLRKLACELEPNSPEANLAMGILYEHEGENKKAFEKFKKAIELNSNSIACNEAIAMFLGDQGLYDTAFKYRNKVVDFDPRWPDAYTNRAYEGYSSQGEYEKAESDFQLALDLDPNHQATLTLYSMFLIRTKKYEKAKEYCIKWSNKDTSAILPRAFIQAHSGNKEEAIYLIENDSTTWIGFQFHNKYWIYTFLGMIEEAFKYLNEKSKFFAESKWTLYFWLLNDPIYDDFRSDPRFQEILKIHKKLYEENLRKYGD